MAGTQVALIRGINVGRAKRVAMSDLRALFEGLGYADVRTLLNSGNVVFSVPSGLRRAGAAARIEKAMAAQLGVCARVTVLSSAEIAAAVVNHPLDDVASDPSRLLVAVLAKASDGARLKPLLKQNWEPEALAVGKRVAYLWCARGILESPLANAVNRLLGDGVTARNMATMKKLHSLTSELRC